MWLFKRDSELVFAIDCTLQSIGIWDAESEAKGL